MSKHKSKTKPTIPTKKSDTTGLSGLLQPLRISLVGYLSLMAARQPSSNGE